MQRLLLVQGNGRWTEDGTDSGSLSDLLKKGWKIKSISDCTSSEMPKWDSYKTDHENLEAQKKHRACWVVIEKD